AGCSSSARRGAEAPVRAVLAAWGPVCVRPAGPRRVRGRVLFAREGARGVLRRALPARGEVPPRWDAPVRTRLRGVGGRRVVPTPSWPVGCSTPGSEPGRVGTPAPCTTAVPHLLQ